MSLISISGLKSHAAGHPIREKLMSEMCLPKWYIAIRPDTPFYYFSPSILYDSKMTLKKGKQLNLKYRLLVSPGKPDATSIQLNWNEFQHQ
jgi:hypothetical protein